MRSQQPAAAHVSTARGTTSSVPTADSNPNLAGTHLRHLSTARMASGQAEDSRRAQDEDSSVTGRQIQHQNTIETRTLPAKYMVAELLTRQQSSETACRRSITQVAADPVSHQPPTLAFWSSVDAEIGRPTPTARRLVDASVSANTRRAYAGAPAAARRLARWAATSTT